MAEFEEEEENYGKFEKAKIQRIKITLWEIQGQVG